MNETPEINSSSMKSSVCDAVSKMSKYSVRCDYDVTVGLYCDDDPDTPECSHRFSGRSQHNVLRLLAIGGIIGVAVAAIRIGCCAICRGK